MSCARFFSILTLCIAALLASGCTTSPAITPDTAIARAAAAPGGIAIVVRLTVKNANAGVGSETGGFYLNSETDYRDPRSLNVIVSARAAEEFAAAGVTDPRAFFVGREILVHGIVRRVRIDDLDINGRPDGRHYFQTQIPVSSARQIERVESGKRPLAQPVINTATAKPATYLAQDPDNPVRALYIYELQKRIDTLFQEQLFSARFGSGLVVPPDRRIRLLVTVLADGRIAADLDEVKHQLKREPELAAVVLNVLARITEKPVPFPDAMVEAGQQMVRFEAAFGVE